MGLRSPEILRDFRGAFAKFQFVKGSRYATLPAVNGGHTLAAT